MVVNVKRIASIFVWSVFAIVAGLKLPHVSMPGHIWSFVLISTSPWVLQATGVCQGPMISNILIFGKWSKEHLLAITSLKATFCLHGCCVLSSLPIRLIRILKHMTCTPHLQSRFFQPSVTLRCDEVYYVTSHLVAHIWQVKTTSHKKHSLL